LPIADCQFTSLSIAKSQGPIFRKSFLLTPIGNWQSAIGNALTRNAAPPADRLSSRGARGIDFSLCAAFLITQP
jgi:hypothetical protein